MSNEQKWALLWNHDVQFGFVCGAFAGVVALVVMFFALDLFAKLVMGRRRPTQATAASCEVFITGRAEWPELEALR